MPVAPLQQLTARLLGHLRHEESLLHTSKDYLTAIHHALRQGDLHALDAARPNQEQLAAELRDASQARAAVALELSQALGITDANPALADIADRLPLAHGHELRAMRDKLREILGEVVELQRANANLVQTLRSYFRGVLSGLTTPEPTTRYGPTGGRLQTVG